MTDNILDDQPAKVLVGKFSTGFQATVVAGNGLIFDCRSFFNPQMCDEFAASWGLPIHGSTWFDYEAERVSLTGLGWLEATREES